MFYLIIKFYLVGDLAFITYSHHALINGDRFGAILGGAFTIVLAVIFTGLQYFEYAEAGFTFADSAYGTVFYASTGLHGLKIAPTKNFTFLFNNISQSRFDYANVSNMFIYKFFSRVAFEAFGRLAFSTEYSNKLFISFPEQSSMRGIKNIKPFYLERHFLEWLAGFTDAEGNFNISLRNLKNVSYNSHILTYQISLHIDDLDVLKLIKNKLQCGHISISGNRCNYFVNDRNSLIYIILPIFNFVHLHSSKCSQFKVFEKALNLVINKEHLSSEGKLKIIKFFYENKEEHFSIKSDLPLSDYWLGGFVDGDATFSTSRNTPRLKFENKINELELLKKIKIYLKAGNIIFNTRIDRPNSSTKATTCILDITNIYHLKNIIIPLFSHASRKKEEFQVLNTIKHNNFNLWSMIVDIKFYGYHRIEEGVNLIEKIKTKLNKLSTQPNKFKLNTVGGGTEFINFELEFKILFSLLSPYEIKNGLRFLRNTNNLVSTGLRISCINHSNKEEQVFSSISNCSEVLKIDRTYIKKYLLNKEKYKNYTFHFFYE